MCVAERSEGTTITDRAWEPQLPFPNMTHKEKETTKPNLQPICLFALISWRIYCHLNLPSLQCIHIVWHDNGSSCLTGQHDWCELYAGSQICRATNWKSNKLTETSNFQWVMANSIKGIPEGANRANGWGIGTITWKDQREKRNLTY